MLIQDVVSRQFIYKHGRSATASSIFGSNEFRNSGGLDNKPRDYSEALAMLYGRNDLPLGHLRRIWTRISPQHQHVCHRRFIWKS